MYKNVYEYIKKNMDHLHGDFTVAVTDMSEMDPDMLLLTIHPEGKDGETADFYMHSDGRERFTKIIGDPMDTQSLTFGQAIEAMKAGKKVARHGWNGKNQHIELATRISYMTAYGVFVNVEHEAIGNNAISFCGTSGVQMGWLASQADMLADDWEIVE